MGKKVQKLSVLLMKKTLDYKLYLKTDKVVEYNLSENVPFKGKIFCGYESSNTPDWVDFLNEGVKGGLQVMENKSNKAVLFVKLEGSVFALTFGFGRYLVNDLFIERDFGLKTVLNAVNPDKLRSMDLANLGDLSLKTRKQSNKGSSKTAFGLDIINDLMSSVTGAPRDADIGRSMVGREQVSLAPKINFAEIGEILSRLNTYYKSDVYKKDFEWIDNVKFEKDKTKIEQLNKQLIDAIQDKDTDLLFLMLPEIIDWEFNPMFSYTPKGEQFGDVSLEDYFREKSVESDIDIDKLKLHKLYVHNGDEVEKVAKWPIYSCLTFETELGGCRYTLTGGNWYVIKAKFVERVIEYAKKIPMSSISFVNHKKGEREDDYNARFADSNKVDYVCLDGKNVKCEMARTVVEPCDILTIDKQFIHVKKKHSSATLSHVFAQGRISGESFLSDQAFRKDLRKKIRSCKRLSYSIIPMNKPKSSEYEIVFAIIDKSKKDLIHSLPFFSLLNLKQTHHALTLMGFKVSIAKIQSN